MNPSTQEAEMLANSNGERLEALEGQTARLANVLEDVTTTLAEMRTALNATTRGSEENRRNMEAMRRETNASIERLERRMANGRVREQASVINEPRHEVVVEEAGTIVSDPMLAQPSGQGRRAGRVEDGHVAIERWAYDDGRYHRSPSVRERPYHEGQEAPRPEDHIEAERNREAEGYHDHEDHWDRGHHHHHPERERRRLGGRYGEDHHEGRHGNRAYDRGPKRPKVDFPKFNGGDPYEWLDKVDHYFHTYEVSRHERVSIACFYLEGKASKWWRWIRDQYEKDEKRLGWTAFEKEFLMQFGPSPTINHHGQLAKLKQEGKVHDYIEEFRQLQTLVRGWSEEALVGTFVDGLKPWIAKEIKLKQPSKIQEAMRMAEILEESSNMERRPSKEVRDKPTTTMQPNKPWGNKDGVSNASKTKPLEAKKLTREEVQDRIKKGLCFKCGDKWAIGHQCKPGQVYMLVDERNEEEDEGSGLAQSSQEFPQEETEANRGEGDAELLLNTMVEVQKHTSMRVGARIGACEVTIVVDSGSTHNFINTNLITKLGLESIAIEPFEVRMANGDKLRCERLIREVELTAQGIRIVADLHVLPLVELDVVLGNPWLKGLGRVVLDYKEMTMEFTMGSKKNTWTTLASKEPELNAIVIMKKKGKKKEAHCFAMGEVKEVEEGAWEVSNDILGGKDVLEGGGNVKDPCEEGHGQVACVLALVPTHLSTTPRASLGHAMAQATSPHGPAQLAQPTMRTALQANHARALAKHMASQHAQPDREPCLARGQQAAQASHAGNQAEHSAGSSCPRPAHACQANHARGPANQPTGPTRPVRPVRPRIKVRRACQRTASQANQVVRASQTRGQPGHARGQPGHARAQPAKPCVRAASCMPDQTLPSTVSLLATSQVSRPDTHMPSTADRTSQAPHAPDKHMCPAQPTRPVRPHMRLTCTCQARLTRPARPHMRATRQNQPAHVRGKPGHAGSQPARPASCSPAQTLPRTIILPATHTSCAAPTRPPAQTACQPARSGDLTGTCHTQPTSLPSTQPAQHLQASRSCSPTNHLQQ